MAAELTQRAAPHRLVWASRLLMGKYLPLARKLGFATVLDEHNVESDLLFQSALSRVAYWPVLALALQCRHYEAAFCKAADQVVAVSNSDATRLRALAPQTKIAVFPNCIDVQGYLNLTPPRSAEAPLNRSLLFIGTLSYHPNWEGLSWFIEKVLPILRENLERTSEPHSPKLQIQVAGANPSTQLQEKLLQAGIELIANPVSVLPLLAQAQVIFVPLLTGSGTRLKIMEAMAAGRAIVSTEKGAEGLELTSGDGLLITSDPGTFAANLIHLLKNPEARQEMEKKALKIAATRFAWQLQREAVSTLLAELSQNPHSSSQGALG